MSIVLDGGNAFLFFYSWIENYLFVFKLLWWGYHCIFFSISRDNRCRERSYDKQKKNQKIPQSLDKLKSFRDLFEFVIHIMTQVESLNGSQRNCCTLDSLKNAKFVFDRFNKKFVLVDGLTSSFVFHRKILPIERIDLQYFPFLIFAIITVLRSKQCTSIYA